MAPILLGSLIFAGVIEHYKNDSTLKTKILDEHFKSAREISEDCLKKQNSLFLSYREEPAQLTLLARELLNLIDHPELNREPNYGILPEALLKSYKDATTSRKELESQVKQCRGNAFRALEVLSISTGTFDEFSKDADIRATSANRIYQTRSEEIKKLKNNVENIDLQEMMRELAISDLDSREVQNSWKARIEQTLPIIEKSGEIYGHTEEQLYECESEFYASGRKRAAQSLSRLFKEGFLGWLL